MVADLALFDPSSVGDEATYDEPTRPALGVGRAITADRYPIIDAIVRSL
jgi:N-acyl-D-aspartate/D-glutamate deacylase